MVEPAFLIADSRRAVQSSAKTISDTRASIKSIESDVEKSRRAIDATLRCLRKTPSSLLPYSPLQ
jgi:hypothetical protein